MDEITKSMNICLTCRYRSECPPHGFVVGYCTKYSLQMKIGTPVIFIHDGRYKTGIFNGGNQVIVGNDIYYGDNMKPVEWGKDIIEQMRKMEETENE
jgi:hypothetical protein